MKVFRIAMLFFLTSGVVAIGQNTVPCPVGSSPANSQISDRGSGSGQNAGTANNGGTAASVPGTATPPPGVAAPMPKTAASPPGPAVNPTPGRGTAMSQAGSATTTQARNSTLNPRAFSHPQPSMPVNHPAMRARGSGAPTTASLNGQPSPCMPSNNSAAAPN